MSYQLSKQQRRNRWFKFKEAFSTDLVEYLFGRYRVSGETVLDPFAGSGTSLFAAAELGMDAVGIELMPIGNLIVRVRERLRRDNGRILNKLEAWGATKPWLEVKPSALNVLRITDMAYPKETEEHIRKFLAAIKCESRGFAEVLLFVLLCVLEEVSYTRKDGQFLRWDNRSGRQLRQIFNKGEIPVFNDSIVNKIAQIVSDEREERAGQSRLLTRRNRHPGKVTCIGGSCLSVLRDLTDLQVDSIITSPPYCNRYDYTRTYALELAAMGVDEDGIRELRQAMLSCTVENKAKDLLQMCPRWEKAVAIANQHPLLMEILDYLRAMEQNGTLNNGGVIRMVEGYFAELACVLHESFRLLSPGGYVFMVNDNVRFAGCEVPVDLILSQFAETIGFRVEEILVLPQRKGNSSQQMGRFGRAALRKCIYCWRKD